MMMTWNKKRTHSVMAGTSNKRRGYEQYHLGGGSVFRSCKNRHPYGEEGFSLGDPAPSVFRSCQNRHHYGEEGFSLGDPTPNCEGFASRNNFSNQRRDHHLYVVLTWHPLEKYSYSVHKINLSDMATRFERSTHLQRKKKHILPQPILKLPRQKFPEHMGFLASGSKFYIFGGGSDYKPPSILDVSTPNLSCHVFETCRNSPNYNILKETPRMHHGKCFPIVIGPLHGKFFVLCHSLAYFDFEEFNPETECWTSLPQPRLGRDENRHYGFCYDHYRVNSHSIKGNKIVLLINNRFIYTYDVLYGSWDVFDAYQEKLSPYIRDPLGFAFGWNEQLQGLYQVYADIEKFGGLVHRRVNGSSGFGRYCVRRSVRSDVLSLEKSSGRLCIVGFGHRFRPEIFVNVDLCRIGKRAVNDDGLQVREHCYATYAVEEPEACGMVACFLI